MVYYEKEVIDMKIIIENFNYKDRGINRCEYDFPQLKDISEVLSDKMMGYVSESLEELLKEEGAQK